MAPPEKPTRLGRGLDALLARRDPPKTADPTPAIAGAVPNAPAIGTLQKQALDSPSAGSSSNAVHPGNASGAASASNASGASTAGQAVGTSAGAAAQNPASATATAQTPSDNPAAPGYRLLPIAAIAPNPFQPRKEFAEQDLLDLESSLRSQGLLQPITVRPSPNVTGYELIAGERRLRAATRLGWKDIPAIVRDTDDRTMLTLAMVENLQRADLDPVEEADGYQRLIDDFSLTQLEVADIVGKERPTVANALRLLALPASVKRMLQSKQITVGHARALLPLETERAMADLARDVVAKSLSVRDVEERVRGARPKPATTGRKAKPAGSGVPAATPAASAELRRVEELLRKKMQTTVSLHLTGKERGEVRITFFNSDDLERVLALMGVHLDN